MTPRIYTAAEAQALAAKWKGYDGPYAVAPDDQGDYVIHHSEGADMAVARVEDFDEHSEPLARLFAAAPDDVKALAATVEAQAAEIARLRERVVISDARLECAHDDNDRLRRERDEARDEVERAEPRRQRDARDIADADGEIVRLRAGLEVAEREAAALRDAAREYLDARHRGLVLLLAHLDADPADAAARDAVSADEARVAATRTRLASLVGGAA